MILLRRRGDIHHIDSTTSQLGCRGQVYPDVISFLHRKVIAVISYRYEQQLPTIITFNLTTQQISEVYGKRIGDRLKETTEIVPFLNGSYRG